MHYLNEKKKLLSERAIKQAKKSYYDNEYTITTARSVQEVEEIRDIWKKMQPHPYVDIDYYLTVVKSREEVIRPHVILLSRNEYPEMMLIGRIEDVQFKYSIGSKVLFRHVFRSLTIILGGILGNTSYANCATLISELIKSLKQRDADIVRFSEIPIDSNIYQLATTVPGVLCRDHFPNSQTGICFSQ